MSSGELVASDLVHPTGSKVSTADLLREVDEYFAAGAKVSPGDTVLDVGANVGAFSLRVAQRCLGDVRLLCFEPSPHTGAALRANFQRNRHMAGTRHTIHHVGLSDDNETTGELSFHHFRRFPTNSTFDLVAKRREFEIFFEDRGRRARQLLSRWLPWVGRWLERVISSLPKGRAGWWATRQIMGLEEVRARLMTLDEVVLAENLARVDLLKIDVEGTELHVLRGLGPTTWPRVRRVVMETHDRDGRLANIAILLRENGLTDIQTTRQSSVDNGLESILLLASRPAAVAA